MGGGASLSLLTVDDAVIAAVREHGDMLCLSDYSGNMIRDRENVSRGPEVDWSIQSFWLTVCRTLGSAC